MLGSCTDSCPAFSSPYFQAHSGLSSKFLILLKLLLGWKRNSPPFMFVSCANQDAGYLPAQYIWLLVYTRQGEEILLWHKNAIVFLPTWRNVSESNCNLGAIKSAMYLWHLLPTLFKSYSFPPKWQMECNYKHLEFDFSPPLVSVTLLKLPQIREWVVQHVHTINGSKNI